MCDHLVANSNVAVSIGWFFCQQYIYYFTVVIFLLLNTTIDLNFYKNEQQIVHWVSAEISRTILFISYKIHGHRIQ